MEKSILKENVIHGTNIYPYAVYWWDGDTKFTVPLHWHPETEIIYLKKGTFTFTINMKEYVQEAPALIFISTEIIHSIQIDAENEEWALVFDLGMLSFENYDGIQYKIIRPLMEGEMHFPQILRPEDEVWSEVAGLYEEMFKDAMKKELSAYLRVKAGLYNLIACLYRNGYLKNVVGIQEADTGKLDILKKVLSYIRKNYNKKLSINEIAGVAGMNAQYFCRFFKRNTGKTVTEYMNDIRINQAARRLSESEDKIIDVAGQCGYDNIGYFIKRFRQSKGISPSAYRKMSLENNKSI